MYPSMPQNPTPMMQGANPAQQFGHPVPSMPDMQQGIGGFYPQGMPQMAPPMQMPNSNPLYMAQGGLPYQNPMYMAAGGQVAAPDQAGLRDAMMRRLAMMGQMPQMQVPQPMAPQTYPSSGKGQAPQGSMADFLNRQR